jgi:hypothetical protein
MKAGAIAQELRAERGRWVPAERLLDTPSEPPAPWVLRTLEGAGRRQPEPMRYGERRPKRGRRA